MMRPSISAMTRFFDIRWPLLLAVMGAACSGGNEADSGFDDPSSTDEAVGTGFSVVTNRYDNNRSGENLSETHLTTANVNKSKFGLLFSRTVDGQTYAQPLYLGGVSVGGKVRNVVYVATEHNNVYAFDADNKSASSPLWQRNLGSAGSPSEFGCSDMLDKVGISSTPVIDKNAGTIYVVAKSKEGSNWVQRLHALDVLTGKERAGSPVTITATVTGSGEGSSGGKVSFNPASELNRAGLLLASGQLYLAFASHCDKSPYHGWVLAYDPGTLKLTHTFNISPNGGKGGIWQAGVGLSADASSVYFAAGNGTTNPNPSSLDASEGVLRLNLSDLKLQDYWIPTDFKNLNATDADMSTGAILLPHHLLLTGSKDGQLYVLDKTNLGKYHSDKDHILQSFVTQGKEAGQRGHVHAGPIYYNVPNQGESIFLWPEESELTEYRMNSSHQLGSPNFGNTAKPGHPGGIITLSANGNVAGTAIIWASAPKKDAWHSTEPGVLYAIDAANISRVLWSSDQTSGEAIGNFAKFCPPTVANGKVYMATFSNELRVYGLR